MPQPCLKEEQSCPLGASRLESMSMAVYVCIVPYLSVQRYVFTLTVSKGQSSDKTKVRVEILPGEIATFELAAEDVVINHQKENIVRGEKKAFRN